MKKSTGASARRAKENTRPRSSRRRSAAPLVSPADAGSGEASGSPEGDVLETSRRAATAEATIKRSGDSGQSAQRGVAERRRVPVPMPAVPRLEGGGTLTRWRKKVGDEVKLGDVLAEIETNVATLEIEARVAGELQETLVPEGGKGILPDQPIAILLSGEDNESAPGARPSGRAARMPAARGDDALSIVEKSILDMLPTDGDDEIRTLLAENTPFSAVMRRRIDSLRSFFRRNPDVVEAFADRFQEAWRSVERSGDDRPPIEKFGEATRELRFAVLSRAEALPAAQRMADAIKTQDENLRRYLASTGDFWAPR
jgi:pyruvate/2-oxoglutarate dehydrogenase complex dihydrolipoamide acyltransferase (E2) component